MSTASRRVNRRDFARTALLVGGAATLSGAAHSNTIGQARRIRTGVIGCGSVSRSYLPTARA